MSGLGKKNDIASDTRLREIKNFCTSATTFCGVTITQRLIKAVVYIGELRTKFDQSHFSPAELECVLQAIF